MALTAGARVGPYEVFAQIGAGGMGEVYRATDTNLSRHVAIKVLPDGLAHDPERLARFEREAKALAALNHPHIAQIYGFERTAGGAALVMELVEGPTLADRIAEGPIPVDESLAIATQIAEALEAAHEQGIVHRDLKPANIKVRPDGAVKVLDFGLAKAAEPAAATDQNVSQLATITTPAMTQAGTVLGTAAYMAPEQAKGRPVDKRADLWAVGAVLYEMLTGRRAFGGEDVAETLVAVLRAEVRWEALPADLPPRVVAVLRRCLQTDLRQRLADAQDFRLALAGAFDTAPTTALSNRHAAPRSWRQVVVPALVGVAATAVVATIGVLLAWPSAPPAPLRRLGLLHPEGRLDLNLNNVVASISPDGRRVAHTLAADGQEWLVVQDLDRPGTRRLYRGQTDSPFFSPDGTWVGFADEGDDTIKRVPRNGGPAQPVGKIGAAGLRGASWGENDVIVFANNGFTGLWQVPSVGGSPSPLTRLDVTRGENGHLWPEVLPGGTAVLFTIVYAGQELDAAEIAVRNLATGEQRILVSGGSFAKYSPTGHIVYASSGTLRAVAFDADTLEVVGEPVEVLPGVRTLDSGGAEFSLARDGSLLYLPGGTETRRLVWVDRGGREEALPMEPGRYVHLQLSADAKRLLASERNADDDMWLMDLEQRTRTRLLPGKAPGRKPTWFQAGARVAWSTIAGEIRWKPIVDAGDGQVLVSGLGRSSRAYAESRTGEELVIGGEMDGRTDQNIGTVAVAGGPPRWLLAERFEERRAALSPDRRWMAYRSNETGRDEVYLRPFPNVSAGRIQVSTTGGDSPLWSRTGQELFYVDTNLRRLVSVTVEPGGTTPLLRARTPLFEWPYFTGSVSDSPYDHPGRPPVPGHQTGGRAHDPAGSRRPQLGAGAEAAGACRLSVLAARLPVIVVLDNIRSLYNTGAFFRTADACAVEKLVLCGITPRPDQGRRQQRSIAKTALGAELSVPWEHEPDAAAAIGKAAAAGYQVAAVETSPHAVDLYSWSPRWPVCLVFGHEKEGVDAGVAARILTHVRIPMFGAKRSLNVATAGGVVLYELLRRHFARGGS